MANIRGGWSHPSSGWFLSTWNSYIPNFEE
jgi:hypothetical protein